MHVHIFPEKNDCDFVNLSLSLDTTTAPHMTVEASFAPSLLSAEKRKEHREAYGQS